MFAFLVETLYYTSKGLFIKVIAQTFLCLSERMTVKWYQAFNSLPVSEQHIAVFSINGLHILADFDHWCFRDMQQCVFDKLNVKFSKYNSENKNVTELWTAVDNMRGWCFISLLEELLKKYLVLQLVPL